MIFLTGRDLAWKPHRRRTPNHDSPQARSPSASPRSPVRPIRSVLLEKLFQRRSGTTGRTGPTTGRLRRSKARRLDSRDDTSRILWVRWTHPVMAPSIHQTNAGDVSLCSNPGNSGVLKMKWTTLTAALVLCAASSANAGLFGHHRHGGGTCCPEPTCCAPAPSCAAPCDPGCAAPCAPACAAPVAPQCCAPAAPACCAPAPSACCAPVCDSGCGHGCGHKHSLLGWFKKCCKRKSCCKSDCCAPAAECCPAPSCAAPCDPGCAAPCAPNCAAPCGACN